MATTRFADHLLKGTTGARPAASSVPAGTLYASSDDGNIYQSDGSSWGTWLAAPTTPATASLTTPGATTTVTGQTRNYTAAATLAFGDPVYLNGSGQAAKADATSAGKFPAVGVAAAAISSSASGAILLRGIARNDSWTWTVGGLVYLGSSALTQTIPSATDNAIQVIGVAESATLVYVTPDLTYATHT